MSDIPTAAVAGHDLPELRLKPREDRRLSAGHLYQALPHAAWEETWLFPQIDKRAQTPWATRLVRFEHRQISRQAELVGTHRLDVRHGPSALAAGELRSDLIALEALVRANLEREERFLLPILETPNEPWTSEWRD